jgi:hypothetical protein
MSGRGLSDDERAFLEHVRLWGSAGYPVKRVGSRHWAFGPWRSIEGPPCVFKTKREAVASCERFLDVLRDALAGRL